MLKTRNLNFLQRRWKTKLRWNLEQRKKKNIDRALENFDDFYGSVYGLRWRNMRAALLTENKYIALVNNFGDTEKTCSLLEMAGAINIKSLINIAKENRDESSEAPKIENSENKIDTKLHDIIKKQEEQEIMSIYPVNKQDQGTKILPDRIQYRDDEVDKKSANENAEGFTNIKPSMEQTIHEDICIDNTRMIYPEQAAGALHNFMPANQIKGKEDWIPESEHYKYYPTTRDFPLKFEQETEFTFPENLHLYTYEMGNCSEFQAPKQCLTGVLSHFLMDGASILPPLMLDIKCGDRVLDACAAPGGKSLIMLQTLYPDQLICNDVQESRINRIRKIMGQYLFDYRDRWDGKRIILNQSDARNITEYDSFDKILVDVPCTTDRHVLKENDNNIFKPTRIKERLRIPELQSGILANCLRLLKPGGSLVYSTCSLSPIQNDGVVHMALEKVFTEYGITATIKDLSILINLFRDIFKFEQPKDLKYGQMIIPFLPANFGPMYFSKITRDS